VPDPYCWPGSDCLRNKLGIRDPELLRTIEGRINACHPFREGNGRTQRSFLRQLAAAAGWRLDWSALDRAANETACRENMVTRDTAGLIAALTPVVVRI
jgi:cell filamentation protein